VLGMLAVLVGMLLKIARWYLLLAADPQVTEKSPRRLAPIAASVLASQLVNAVYPVRLGEIGRVAVVGDSARDYAFVAGTLAAEKALDLLAFIGLLALFPFVSRMSTAAASPAALPPGIIKASTFVMLGLILLAGACLYLWVRRSNSLRRWMPEKFTSLAGRLLAGISVLRAPRTLFATLLLTLMIWLAALLPNMLAFQALGLKLPAGAALLVLLFLQVGISAPSLPGKVGIFEYACQLALSFYALAVESGLSYGILLHTIVYVPVLLCGIPAIWIASLIRASNRGGNNKLDDSTLVEEI
jgi:uncharacterized membrane protein YbhN (UPF0104 family)